MYNTDSHARDDTGIERHLRRQRGEKGADSTSTGTDVVPIKRQREETETLVSSRTTEDAGDPRALAIRKADNGYTGKGAIQFCQ